MRPRGRAVETTRLAPARSHRGLHGARGWRVHPSDWYPVRVDGVVIGLGVVVREVTEHKRTEELQRLLWDVERVRRLLGNLLSNAAKYGDPGSPIAMQCRDTADEVVLDVQNRGPSIPSDRLARIFEPLQQAGDADRRSGGIGLGLYIARQIAHAHGGEIAARSAEGTTTFTVRLPRRPPAADRL